MVFDWLHFAILLFLIAGGSFAILQMVICWLLSPKAKGGAIGSPYECGIPPQGDARSRFGVNYYVYALIFIAFDVDVLYLFPVSAQYILVDDWSAFIKVVIFLSFIGLSIAYFWAKGVFTWPRRIKS